MNRRDAELDHRATRRQTPTLHKILLLFSVVALLLLMVVLLPPAAAEAATHLNGYAAEFADSYRVNIGRTVSFSLCCLCPPPPPPTVARPRVQTTGEDLNGGGLAPGDEILWTITAKNIGGATLTDVVVTDTIPEWTSYVDGSMEGFVADDSELPTLTWHVGTLKSGEKATLTFRSRVKDDVPEGTCITNQASVDPAQTPPGTSKEVCMEVLVSAAGASPSSSSTAPSSPSSAAPSSPTTIASSPTTLGSSSTTVAIEAADYTQGPTATATGDEGADYRLGLGLGLGLGGLAVVALGTWLLLRRRKANA